MAEIATVILAAGKGKRMKSDLPKVLHPLNGRPMVQYVIDLAEAINSQKIVLVVGHKKELVMEATKNRQVEYVVQEPQLGTGHAIVQTEPLFKDYRGNILVLSGDVPLLRAESIQKLIHRHEEENPLVTLLTSEMEDPAGYGRVLRNEYGFVEKIVEDKDADEATKQIKEINVAIYIFKSIPLFKTLPLLKNHNKQGEYYLPDVIKIYVERKEKIAAVLTPDVEETHGINDVEQLVRAEEILLSREG